MEYTNITFEDLLSNFKTNLTSDDHFKHINSATIYGMFMEMLAASTDMTNYNMQRILEEAFFRTARNDSSYIKLCRNFGYSPQRPVPAQTTLHIVLKGPFPREFKTANNVQIDFTKELVQLSYLGHPYILDGKYSYKFTRADLDNCTDPTWRKTLRSASTINKIPYNQLQIVDSSLNNSQTIKCFQGEEKIVEFNGNEIFGKKVEEIKKKTKKKQHNDEKNYAEQFDHLGQFYDINDISFSNWYSYRDPFAINDKHEYAPNDGITKVILAKTQSQALSDFKKIGDIPNHTLFRIEDSSIFLSPQIIDSNTIPEKPFDICCITTNEDKTVRINFSSLNYIANEGITYYTNNDGTIDYYNLYVKYLSTIGAAANKLGVKGSQMMHKNKFYVTVDGKYFDITNNIEFVISTDITGGKDFESKQSMRDNAIASYYNSMMKLVSKRDFINYFSTLTSPINVKTALIASQNDIDNTLEMLDKNPKLAADSEYMNLLNMKQNTICYSLIGDLYRLDKTNKTQTYYPINVLMTPAHFENKWPFDFCKPESVEDALTLYCDEYPEHVTDYLKLLISPGGYFTKYVKNAPTGTVDEILNDPNIPQYEKNIALVTTPIEKACTINTILYSLPPFMQYFDIVGDVKVKSLTKNIDEYKLKMSNKIYKYLNELSTSSREIYKSDIIKLYTDDPDTESVDIDIKVSSILVPSFITRKFTNNPNVILIRNLTINKNLANVWGFNEIIIPKYDDDFTLITDAITENNQISSCKITLVTSDSKPIDINIGKTACTIVKHDDYYKIVLHTPYSHTNIPLDDSTTTNFKPLSTDTSELETKIKELEPNTNSKIVNAAVAYLSIETTNNQNYYTISKLDNTNIADDYGLESSDQITKINKKIDKWLKNLHQHNEADRAIDLPYTVRTNSITTRQETTARKGNLIYDIHDTLSEYSFWNYFAKQIINDYYPNIQEDTDLDSQDWKQATRLLIDIYKLVKPGITDSILDDNNNIVNFSTDLDVAVLCNKVNVLYK